MQSSADAAAIQIPPIQIPPAPPFFKGGNRCAILRGCDPEIYSERCRKADTGLIHHTPASPFGKGGREGDLQSSGDAAAKQIPPLQIPPAPPFFKGGNRCAILRGCDPEIYSERCRKADTGLIHHTPASPFGKGGREGDLQSSADAAAIQIPPIQIPPAPPFFKGGNRCAILRGCDPEIYSERCRKADTGLIHHTPASPFGKGGREGICSRRVMRQQNKFPTTNPPAPPFSKGESLRYSARVRSGDLF